MFSQVISYFNYINRVADALGLDPEPDPDLSGRTLAEEQPSNPAPAVVNSNPQ